MGYSFSMSGHLCCDHCGIDTGVRKRKCPHNYCPPAALCDTCYKERSAAMKEYHDKHCRTAAAEYDARKAERSALESKGVPVRCSALANKKHGVHVIFRSSKGEVGYYMSTEVYRSIPLLANATPADYRKMGKLKKAPTTFYSVAAKAA